MPSSFSVQPVERAEITHLRDMYRQEMNCQIVHDSYYARAFTSIYTALCDGKVAGYGCVGDYDSQGKEVVTEFYLTPAYRDVAVPLFRELLTVSEATQVESQTNDRLLTLMLYDFCALDTIISNTILFEDAARTHLPAFPLPEGAVFRRLPEEEKQALGKDLGDWVVEIDSKVAGSGGFLCHYNPPYGDVYMEVEEEYRQRGVGSYLVQEIKRVCYEAGKRPAARCNVTNTASRRTLQRAGMLPCARFLRGKVTSPG